MHRLRDLGAQVPGAPEDVVEGRVPPHDLDAEGAVLSAVLIDTSAFAKVKDFLLPEHFYSEAHRRIFEACVEMSSKDKPIDLVQVATWLRDHDRLKQVGGMAYMTEVLNSAPAVANVRVYAKTVYEKWRVRQFIHACQEAVATGYVGYGEAQPFMDRFLDIFQGVVWTDNLAAPSPAHSREEMRAALWRHVAEFGAKHGLSQVDLRGIVMDLAASFEPDDVSPSGASGG